jgi:UDP-glucuronate decarboxylase
LHGDKITIYGTGEQTRSFCYVDDLIEGLIRLMNVEGVHDPVNLGNAGEFTIKELADEVARSCNVPIQIEYLPLPQDDPQQRRPDGTRAEQLLGWTPRIPLREGLQLTVDFFAARMGLRGSGKASAS